MPSPSSTRTARSVRKRSFVASRGVQFSPDGSVAFRRVAQCLKQTGDFSAPVQTPAGEFAEDEGMAKDLIDAWGVVYASIPFAGAVIVSDNGRRGQRLTPQRVQPGA